MFYDVNCFVFLHVVIKFKQENMKKKTFYCIAVFLLSVCTYTVSINKANVWYSGLSLLTIEQLAFGEELPEVIIVCGNSTTTGRCWRGVEKITWTPFGPMCEWDCYKATGLTSDVCIQGMPCDRL